MKINTRDFGEIEVTKEELYTFPEGIFAFEDCKQFALISPMGEDVFPKWLQYADDVTPCFIVFDPAIVLENYGVKLSASEKMLLKFTGGSADNKDMRLLAIANVPSNFKKTTLNMRAPIVINEANRLAAQVIHSVEYDYRFPLYSEDDLC
jgi:flagellar assembly factor FliW